MVRWGGEYTPSQNINCYMYYVRSINDLEKGLKCKVSKFADDTKVVTSVRNNDGCIKLQGDLDILLG